MLSILPPYYAVVNEIPFTPSSGVIESAVSNSNSAATLTNGNIAIAYINSDVLTNSPRVAVYTPDGTVAVAASTVGSTVSAFTSVASLLNGNFVVAYRDGGTTLVTFAVYTPAGIWSVSPTSIANTAGATSIVACSLSNGNFAIGFTMSSTVYITVFAPNGTVVLAKTAANMYGATCTGLAITGLVNGNVVTSTYTSYYGAGTSRPVVAIMQQNGSFVQSGVQIQVGNSSYSSIVGLPNGNFAIAYSDRTNIAPYPVVMKIYTDNAVQVGSTITIGVGAAVSPKALCLLTNGNLAIIYNGSDTFPYYSVFSQAGIQTKAATLIDSNSVYSISYLAVAGIYGGNLAAFYAANGNAFPTLATLRGA